MNDQTSLIDRLSRVAGDMAGSQVVSAGKDRAEKTKRLARAQWPATREDLQRIHDQLDRIEAKVEELSARIETPASKPRRKAASAGGSAKTES